jgi:WD40 repeat protein/serine/threonine protein kinase
MLQSLLADELSAEQDQILSKHLAVCLDCQRRLDELIGDPPPVIFSSPPTDRSPEVVPSIEGLGELVFLDRGGMGCVYRARDLKLYRDLAVKVMTSIAVGNHHVVNRFKAETQITAQLTHPNIVPIHDTGILPDGRLYYTMKLVEGQRLDSLYGEDPPVAGQLRQRIQVFLQVCQAVSYAHSKGVLHRDLKPQNIMVGRHGEVQVMDWGLAKVRTDGDSLLTHDVTTTWLGSEDSTRGTLGTTTYMAPEHATGATHNWRVTADIYSLGGILYALLTGRAPRSGSADEVREQARSGSITPPRQLSRDVPRALEAVCLKALEREPIRRYQSVDDLMADGECWLADEPVSVWKEPWTTRVWRWVRRHRVLTSSMISSLAATVLILSVVSGTLSKQKTELESANEQLKSEQRRTYAQRLAAQAREQSELNNRDVALALGLESAQIDPSLARELYRLAYVGGQCRTRMKLHTDVVSCVAYGRQDIVLSGSWDETIAVSNAKSGELVRRLTGHLGRVNCVSFRADDQQAVSVADDGRVIIWDLSTGHQLKSKDVGEPITALEIHSVSGDVYIGTKSGKLIAWDVDADVIKPFPDAHSDKIEDLALFGGQGRIVSVSRDASLKVWDSNTATLDWELLPADKLRLGHAAGITSIGVLSGFKPEQLVTTCADGQVRLVDVEDHDVTLVGVNIGHTQPWVTSVAVSPYGDRFVTGGADNQIILWDSILGIPVERFGEHGAPVRGLAFPSHGPPSRLASGSEDGTVRIWDTVDPALRFSAHLPRVADAVAQVFHLSYASEDSLVFSSTSGGGSFRRGADGNWGRDAAVGARGGPFSDGQSVRSFAKSDDGRFAITGHTRGGVANVWNLQSGELISTLTGVHKENEEILSVAFSPSGRHVATASADNSVMLWEAATGRKVWAAPWSFSRNPWAIAFVTEHTVIVGTETSDSDQPGLALWDFAGASRGPLRRFDGHTDAIYGLTLSADRKRFLSSSADRSAILWSLDSEQPIRRFKGHSGPVYQSIFSPDGRKVLTGAGGHSSEKSVRLWDVESGAEVMRCGGHASNVAAVAFSPDGREFVSGDVAGMIQMWRPEPMKRIVSWTRNNRYVPELTSDQLRAFQIDPALHE